ncbi:hypothetical protein [Streptomyces sp. NBC_00648]|uniref:hypothetical protein n=1 Tax=Streptomyces sp. NBC_00648 TaxID=2975797 RepID=UPI00324C129A
MTSPIDGVLARARLSHQPCTEADVDAAEQRLAARAAAPPPTVPARAGRHRLSAWRALLSEPGPPLDEVCAAQDLTVVCEMFVIHPDALDDLKLFFARALPEPAGARILGCMLHLTGRPESARFWWQYAAGAGDAAATFCLGLHHRALGEHPEAEWWHTQADTLSAHGTTVANVDLTTTLRILRALRTGPLPVPDLVHAVLDYIPAALSYVDDDLDLPLPDPDFADHITALTAHAATTRSPRTPPGRAPAPLPERPTHDRPTFFTTGWPVNTGETWPPGPSDRPWLDL